MIGIPTVPLEGLVLGLDLGTTYLTRGVEVVKPQLIAILMDAILAANLWSAAGLYMLEATGVGPTAAPQ